MFEEVQNAFAFSLTFGEVIARFLVALVCGFLVSLFYKWSYKGTSYSPSYVTSLVLLSMITASVIMVIGNNLARAFGLVGAMSIIRFRSAVKDTQDIIFIFYSLAMGMAAGVGLFVVAISGTLFIGLIVWLLSITNFAVPITREYLLQFRYLPNGADTPSYLESLQGFTSKYKLINVKSIGEDEKILELSFYIKLRDIGSGERLMESLGDQQGVQNANLFFDEVQV